MEASEASDRPGEYRVGVVQRPPVFLDREATLACAIESLEEATEEGARLVVFPETLVPGYPEFVWRLRPGLDGALFDELYALLLANAVDLEADGLAALREAATRLDVSVVIGVDEIDGSFSRATLYNTLVLIGPDGAIRLRHRKLMPTNAERMVWGEGDGVGLDAVETPVGRVGGLICFENYMPLARFALYAQGVQIYVAPTWDQGEIWLATMRHIAAEGRCWVIGCGNALRASDIPAHLPGRTQLYPDPDEWINPGDSVIVDPRGNVVAGPLHRELGILYADCDPGRAVAAHRNLDVAGHYARADVFRLVVDRRPRPPAELGEGH